MTAPGAATLPTSLTTGEHAPLLRFAARDFRNLEHVEITSPPEGFTLVGENGHGKTNLLEAIYYLHLLRSARGGRDQDLVRFDSAGFHLAAESDTSTFRAQNGARSIAVGYERATRCKLVRIDGKEPERLSDALGTLPAVMFAPRDVDLIAGPPAARRRFLDVALALTSRRYLAAFQIYRAALARRNAALRALGGGGGVDLAAVWEPALAEHGAILRTERLSWVERFAQPFAERCAAMGEEGPSRMRYVSRLDPTGDPRSALLADFAARRVQDVRRGVTGSGPHRDELELTLGGRELRTFGSAGQQRTAAIALRMLEAETIREAAGAEPLLLLDDPFAELDARRTVRILELLLADSRRQTVLAVPRETDIPAELARVARLRIVRGVVAPVDGMHVR